MPVLPLEPFVYPEHLFAERDTINETQGQWWVLRTKPRAEKMVARKCLAMDISFFLPLYQPKDGNAHFPLFPGYLFLIGDHDARIRALSTKQIAQCLPVVDQAELAADLSRVHDLMTSEDEVIPETKLIPGAKIEITMGAFEGMTGTLIRRGSSLRILVEVRLLRQGVSVELDRGMFRILS